MNDHELPTNYSWINNWWEIRGQFMDFRVRVRACSQIASVVKYVFYVFLSKKKKYVFYVLKKYVFYVFLSKKEEYVLYVFLS